MSARLLLVWAALLAGGVAVRADEPEPPPAPGSAAMDPQVARITGEGVNLRVGPRVDNEPVTQLKRGAVVIAVEAHPGWYGVRVPAGFPVAVSSECVAEENADEVRVTVRRLNARVFPPEEGRPQPAALRDQFQAGQVLARISTDRGWTWVLAPEELVAFVSADYVELLGPLEQNAERVVAARDERAQELARLKKVRAAAATAAASLALRGAIGAAQHKLHRLRLEGGNDKTPVALVHDELKDAVAKAPHAPPAEAELAALMLEDLVRELDLREARAEAAIAKARGTPLTTPLPSIAESEAAVEIEGELRWEAVPGWQDGGVYVLWVGERPRRVMRLGTGGPLPHPDLKARCDGRIWRFRGSSPGERTLGLPVIDVREVLAPTSLPR
jgi:hypothetical protein